jgi:hypothetical protein
VGFDEGVVDGDDIDFIILDGISEDDTPIRPKPLMPSFVGVIIAMAEEFLDGRNMSSC